MTKILTLSPSPGTTTPGALLRLDPSSLTWFFFPRRLSGVSQDPQWHQWDPRVSLRGLHLPPPLSALAGSFTGARAAALWGCPGPPQVGPYRSTLSEGVCGGQGSTGLRMGLGWWVELGGWGWQWSPSRGFGWDWSCGHGRCLEMRKVGWGRGWGWGGEGLILFSNHPLPTPTVGTEFTWASMPWGVWRPASR